MKCIMVIPSYWGREKSTGVKEGDITYDHPTALDEKGTLSRCLESLRVLKDRDFTLVIIGAATSPDISRRVEERIADTIKSVHTGLRTFLFSHSHLEKIHKIAGRREFFHLLQLKGYSPIRNLCLLCGEIFQAEAVIFIDDDEVFEDPHFLKKAKEFIGRKVNGKEIKAVAGYYLQPDGDYHLKKEVKPWMVYWDNLERMNEAFHKVIGKEPRLKETPFVFGGNMVIHRDLYRAVPFDPNVPRGEDIDYLMNARMFGFHFFLDNQLSIKHLPPPNPNPTWLQLRKDIHRFVFEREKLNSQRKLPGITLVTAEEFDPYPGAFLKEDLQERVYKSNQLLAMEYLLGGDGKGCQEALNNIMEVKRARPEFNPFENLLSLQKRWQALMSYLAKPEIHSRVRKIWGEG
ncbi:glycosyltransferase [candidate division NPL-UPA2 bacterium]|nr:glycosyltransferase [candidate division NPL-UPA2 bacterium]